MRLAVIIPLLATLHDQPRRRVLRPRLAATHPTQLTSTGVDPVTNEVPR
jgi:hypothetical protein